MTITLNTWELLLVIHLILNAFVTSKWISEDSWYYKGNWRYWLWITLCVLFGSVYFLLIPIGFLYVVFTDYIKPEIQFYWRFHLTGFFERLVMLSDESQTGKIDYLWGWNELARCHNKGHVKNRLQRHVNLLNKRFNYDYEVTKTKHKR